MSRLLCEELVTTSAVWSLLSIIGFFFIGLVLLKETPVQLQLVGAAIGVAILIILILAFSFR